MNTQNLTILPGVSDDLRLATERVQFLFTRRSASMADAAIWRECADALRSQADAMDANDQGDMARLVREDAWDCEEHAVRLETHNNRDAVMAVRARRAQAVA